MQTDNDILIANQGSFILNSTTEKVATIIAIVILEDTVFTHIKIAGATVTSTYIAKPADSVKAGAILRAKNSAHFDKVKLTSGSVLLILGA